MIRPTQLRAGALLLQIACVSDPSSTATTLTTSIASAGDTTGETDTVEDDDGTDTERLDLGEQADLPPMEPEECVSMSDEAELVPKPIDVVLFVDTSGSMENVSNAVEQNLNALLAAIVAQDMIDVRVIVVASYGAGEAMCVAAPLGQDACAPPGPLAPLGPLLFQYSVGLGSQIFLDLIIDTYTGAQTANAAVYDTPPVGWQEWARPEAFKAIIAVTDAESMSGNPALGDAFDAELLALAPEQFGTPEARNYVLHAITGIGANTPDTEPYPPDAPLVTTTCAGLPGQPVQQVAILTGGFRFPLCGYQNFGMLFDDIATNIVESTPVACDFDIPDPPEGETLDPETLEVEYLPGGAAPGELFHQVPTEADCEDDAFWVDAETIHLCPTACTLVQADLMARIDVRYGCDVGYDPNG